MENFGKGTNEKPQPQDDLISGEKFFVHPPPNKNGVTQKLNKEGVDDSGGTETGNGGDRVEGDGLLDGNPQAEKVFKILAIVAVIIFITGILALTL